MATKCWFLEAPLYAQTTDEDEWDDEDLLSLLPPGVTFKDYAVCDSNVATAKTISDDWESYLLLVPELLRMVAVRISPPAQAMRMRARTAR